MRTQTLNRHLVNVEKIEDTPAVHAGIAVLAFLVAALAPLGLFVVLVVLHLLASFLWRMQKRERAKRGRVLLHNAFSDGSLLFFALVMGVTADIVITDALGGFLAIVVAVGGVILPKLQLLKQTLSHEAERLPHAATKMILVISLAMIVLLPVVSDLSLPETLQMLTKNLFSSRF